MTRKFALVAIFVIAKALPAHAWQVAFKDEAGAESLVEANVAEMSETNRKLMYLAVPSPVAQVKTASQLADDAPADVATKKMKDKTYLLLTVSHGSIELTDENGVIKKYDFEVRPSTTALRVSKTCLALGLRMKVSTQVLSPYPAALTCAGEGKNINEIVFSTFADAEWYGNDIFETDGKGERWKSFATKDLAALPKWDVTWGATGQKNKIRFVIITTGKKIPPVPQPAFQFWVGGRYLTGQIQLGDVTTPAAGLQIPLMAVYHRDKVNWLMGTRYDFFAYATSKAGNSSNAISGWNLWAGYEKRFASVVLRGRLGYLNRSVDAPGVQTSTTFEAPRAGLDLEYNRGKATFGAKFDFAQTSSQGTFNETDLGIFYESPWAAQRIRYDLESSQLTATTGSATFKTNWLAIGLLFRF